MTEEDSYFREAQPFDIYKTLPHILKNRPSDLKLKDVDAKSVLDRWNTYIWSDTPNVWNDFKDLSKRINRIKDNRWMISTSEYLFDFIYKQRIAIKNISNNKYVAGLASLDSLKEYDLFLSESEETLRNTLQKPFLGIFYSKGRKINSEIEEIEKNVQKSMRLELPNYYSKIMAFGHEYRSYYLSKQNGDHK